MQLFRAQQAIIARYEIKDGPKVYETKINGKPWALFNDTVIGYDVNGKEVVRMTVEEGIQKRPAERPNSI